jgi:hypothetical protein
MKLLTTLLIASVAALAVYTARRRIGLALKVGAVVYVVVLFARLVLSAGSLADRLEDWLWPAIIVLVVWAVLSAVSVGYAQRKAARKSR